MRKTVFLSAFVALLFIASTASALEIGSKYKPESTSSFKIAMLFHKLARAQPDFKSWAMQTDAYRRASRFDKQIMLNKVRDDLTNAYGLLSVSEPIIVPVRVQLSKYSYAMGGFLIDSFKEDTYFDFNFSGQDYALVMPGLIESQWIPAPPESEEKELIEDAMTKQGRYVDLILYIEPRFADSSAQMTLDGKNYWLISGRVRNITMYHPSLDKVVWHKDNDVYNNLKQGELMKLFQ